MATSLVNQFTATRAKMVHYVVYQAKDSTTFTGVTNGTILLPPNSLVTLVTSAGVRNTKFSAEVPVAWSVAEGATVSTATVSDSLKLKPAIVALTSGSTAADIVAALKL